MHNNRDYFYITLLSPIYSIIYNYIIHLNIFIGNNFNDFSVTKEQSKINLYPEHLQNEINQFDMRINSLVLLSLCKYIILKQGVILLVSLMFIQCVRQLSYINILPSDLSEGVYKIGRSITDYTRDKATDKLFTLLDEVITKFIKFEVICNFVYL